MLYGFVIPGGDARTVANLAREAEEASWDGVFIPDCICIEEETSSPLGFDPWIMLAAIAMLTERIRMGTMITPLSRRRPWKVARETLTLDHLSGGRLILPVGLGALDDAGFGKVGEETDRKVRAELLDESLEIIEGLWSGQPFSYSGKHYNVQETTFLPPTVQSPRIPVWVVAVWPAAKSMRRALCWDGVIPAKAAGEMTPDDIREMKAFIDEQRAVTTPYDIVVEGETLAEEPEKAAATLGRLAEAGATWWMETMWSAPDGLASVRTRINQGPPPRLP